MNWEIKNEILYIYKEKIIKYGIDYIRDWNEWKIYRARKFRWFKPYFKSDDEMLYSILFNGRLELNILNKNSLYEFLYKEKEIMLINRNTNTIYVGEQLKYFLESQIVMEKLI